MNKVNAEVISFLKALEQSEALSGFPIACYKAASIMLQIFLIEYNLADSSVVKVITKSDGICGHFWVEVGDVVFDITSAQFGMPTIGDRETWHKRFAFSNGEFEKNGGCASWLNSAYEKTCTQYLLSVS